MVSLELLVIEQTYNPQLVTRNVFNIFAKITKIMATEEKSLNFLEQIIEEDLKNGLNKRMMPLVFQQMREEYLAFPCDIFRKHIYQEERKQREMPMKISKCNNNVEKQHKDVVEEAAARWHAEQEHDDLVNEMASLMV